MTPRRAIGVAVAAAAAVAALAIAPLPVAAHPIGQVFTLPVPLALYLTGAGVAVAASFVVSVVVVRPAGRDPRYPTLRLPVWLARGASALLQALGLAWWLTVIFAGFTADTIPPLPAILFWIGLWIGMPIVAIVLGNPWPSLSPFRTLFWMLESATRRLGLDRLDAGLSYPRTLGRWPAVIFLFAALWAELVLPESEGPRTVGTLLVGYTGLTLLGMMLFGRVAWLRNAELFEVLLGWFGRLGPLGRRVVQPTVCVGCADQCNPKRCVDCLECAAAAEGGERAVELRPWFAGLTEVRAVDFSDAGFIVLALAGVTYDGLQETGFYGSLMTPIFTAFWETFGALNTVLLIQTAGLIVMWIAFIVAFLIAVRLTQSLHDPERRPEPLGPLAGAYAATLLPIAAGYFVAHYLTVLIQSAAWLPELLANPLATVAPSIDWIPISLIWYLSVAAIVGGHIVAVVLAHRAALRDSPSRPLVAGLPLVALMVGYTVLSLWIIAAPITLEPGVVPAALLIR